MEKGFSNGTYINQPAHLRKLIWVFNWSLDRVFPRKKRETNHGKSAQMHQVQHAGRYVFAQIQPKLY